ncbi:D-alanyl-D-alanine carboxypeptidase family protein [uncultured Flavonifractor sp.]|uniref:D-alanyl-D-alanine carboxypeptidase family protein n=1 Tax=uncultured Flavonifractor sp. TaxID=1193534 RepID=UPI0026016DD1|nr:D-alanyl-D-alanine carboxypeptidase family protein [uncultured Flavonifractor sp.]
MGRGKRDKRGADRRQVRRRGRRWVLAAVCLALAAALALWRPWRRTVALPEELTATSVLVLDGAGGVLAQREADLPRSPSSLTKLLSLYLILEDVENGKLALEERVRVPLEAANTTGSKYGLYPGQEVTVEQLLAGSILNSGCDCVLTLATLSAGSEAAFVERMNQAAAELGLTGSHFVNATGLDAAEHYMTARDLGVLARRLVEDHPLYLDYSSQAALELDGLRFRNLNRLAGTDPRVLGLKTGTSPIGGNNLVTYARRGEESCYIVLLDSASETLRFFETEQLLDLVLGGEA